jgi:hypothetical protein
LGVFYLLLQHHRMTLQVSNFDDTYHDSWFLLIVPPKSVGYFENCFDYSQIIFLIDFLLLFIFFKQFTAYNGHFNHYYILSEHTLVLLLFLLPHLVKFVSKYLILVTIKLIFESFQFKSKYSKLELLVMFVNCVQFFD